MSWDGPIDRITVDSLRSWLVAWLAEALGMDRRQIQPGRAFPNYGLDSLLAMLMVGDLEATFGRRLPPTLAWDYPSVDAMAAHLADRFSSRASESGPPPAVVSGFDDPRTPSAGLNAAIDRLDDRELGQMVPQYA